MGNPKNNRHLWKKLSKQADDNLPMIDELYMKKLFGYLLEKRSITNTSLESKVTPEMVD